MTMYKRNVTQQSVWCACFHLPLFKIIYHLRLTAVIKSITCSIEMNAQVIVNTGMHCLMCQPKTLFS